MDVLNIGYLPTVNHHLQNLPNYLNQNWVLNNKNLIDRFANDMHMVYFLQISKKKILI